MTVLLDVLYCIDMLTYTPQFHFANLYVFKKYMQFIFIPITSAAIYNLLHFSIGESWHDSGFSYSMTPCKNELPAPA